MKSFVSDFSGTKFPDNEKISGRNIRYSLLKYIQEDHPNFTENSFLSEHELNAMRESYISNYLKAQLGDLSDLEKTVVDSITNRTTLAGKLDDDDDTTEESLGSKMADKVAEFGGSWTFIIIFCTILFVWIGLNTIFLHNKGFDPYPFILLNLLLSCIAAIQAPIIMMSQNRQETKDRIRAKKDYMVNLKSEIEIRALHEKLDHLIVHQQQEMLEFQKIQIEMLNDVLKSIDGKKNS